MKRRDFIHHLSHLSAATFSSPLFGNTNFFGSILNETKQQGKILIIIKLDGGNDGLNTIIPLDQYSNLKKARPHVIIPENKILKLENNDIGLHPELSGFKSLYEEKRFKIVQNVGYETPNFSHFRSMDIWESASDYNKFINSGWMARYIESKHSVQNISDYPHPLAIEINRNSFLFTGKNGFSSFVVNDPNEFYEIIGDFNSNIQNTTLNGLRLNFINSAINSNNTYGGVIKECFNSGKTSPNFNTIWEFGLGRQLEIVAKLIDGGLNTRIYSVSLGGFDTHNTQVDEQDHSIGEHARLLKDLNNNILTFMQNMDKIGRSDDVLIMTFSEFGRTIASNSAMGTDHGTAAPMFIFGNKVDSTILGNNPVIPSNVEWQDNLSTEFDFRQVYSSIMNQWLTVNPTTEEDVLFKKFDQLPIIQAKYVDTDGDGVSDDRDLCDATPLGAMVNTDGCEIFSLPVDNYSIQTNGVSCAGKTNGQINISVQNTDYTYGLSIAESESSYTLNAENGHQLVITELEIGTYTLNFTVEGKEGYVQTFEIGITEPPALSAKSSVNQKGKTMTLNLSGSDLYYAEVNGERRSYQLDAFTLQLRAGMNTVKISTPQDCQGVYTENVFISEQVKHYPNPVRSNLNLVIPGEDTQTSIEIYSRSGSLVSKSNESVPFSRVVTINTSQLPRDLYVVKVKGQTVDQTFKMIKR